MTTSTRTVDVDLLSLLSEQDLVTPPATEERPVVQIPTLSGKVDGIVGWDPMVLQCRGCGSTWTNPYRRTGAGVILSGYHFHRHSKVTRRLCPDCLSAEKAACETCQRVGTR